MLDSVHVERLWPYVAAFAVLGAWWLVGHPFPEPMDALLGTAATVASVFAGFLGVAKSIILSLKSSEIYKKLKDLNLISRLFSYLKSGTRSAIVFAVLSILGFFINKSTATPEAAMAFKVVWIFSGSLAVLTYIRIGNILFKILNYD